MSNSPALAPDLTVTDVAKVLNLSKQSVRAKILSGEIPGYRTPGGRCLRVRPETLEQIRSAVKPEARKE